MIYIIENAALTKHLIMIIYFQEMYILKNSLFKPIFKLFRDIANIDCCYKFYTKMKLTDGY